LLLQKQGKKLRREGKDKWIDFAGKVRTYSCLTLIEFNVVGYALPFIIVLGSCYKQTDGFIVSFAGCCAFIDCFEADDELGRAARQLYLSFVAHRGRP